MKILQVISSGFSRDNPSNHGGTHEAYLRVKGNTVTCVYCGEKQTFSTPQELEAFSKAHQGCAEAKK